MNETLIMLPEKHRYLIRTVMKNELHQLEDHLSFVKEMIGLHWNNSDKTKPHSERAFKLLNMYKSEARIIRKRLTLIRSILQVMK
jgi:hypothetical protein